eukprot:g30829.t1
MTREGIYVWSQKMRVFTKKCDMVDGESQERYIDVLGQVNINKEVVLGVLKSIKVNKYPGPDGIYSRILREAGEDIAVALYKIIVSSLVTGEVPADWEIANVVPLFKKGNRILGFQLFIIYVNDLEQNVVGLI